MYRTAIQQRSKKYSTCQESQQEIAQDVIIYPASSSPVFLAILSTEGEEIIVHFLKNSTSQNKN